MKSSNCIICLFNLSSSLVGRNFLTLKDYTGEEIKKFLWTAVDLKHRIKVQNEVEMFLLNGYYLVATELT